MKQANSSALVLYPHQLFEIENLPIVSKIYLIEEPLFFGTDLQYPLSFHKQKLLLHRASMQHYAKEYLTKNKINYKYVELSEIKHSADIFKTLATDKITNLYFFDVCDYVLEKRLKTYINQHKEIVCKFLPSPSFILNKAEIEDFFVGKTKYSFAEFYKVQRKKLNILISEEGKPIGDKWSFDVFNRQKLPRDITIPKTVLFSEDKYIEQAKSWVNKNFSNNPGEIDEFIWPINHNQAKLWLEDFIKNKLTNFGPYEDAIDDDQSVLIFHSGLSAALNNGLLLPSEFIKAVLDSYQQDKQALASVEGLIRQIIGWREYMRAIYISYGSKLRNSNQLKHNNKLNYNWWQAKTGIIPLDNTIKKVIKYAYAHHIERLMILGNLMLLSEIEPDEVYKWFMSLFIDAYDWVMVPNVYGMSQYSDLGSMVTKPYISGSNYILKMSRYKKEPWAEAWNGLFWNFVAKHQDLLKNNLRTSMMVRNYQKFSPEKKVELKTKAGEFIKLNTKL